MTFTVEDGTGLTDANSYIAVAYADAYHSARGNTTWDGTTAYKQTLLIKATDYIDTRWGLRFKGTILLATQALKFPRNGLYDSLGNMIEGLPENLKKAAAEYALRALSAPLMPDPVTDETGRVVIGRDEKIGPISESIQYAKSESVQQIKPYPAADRLLAEYINSSGRVSRA